MTRRLPAALAAAVLLLGLAGCASDDDPSEPTSGETAAPSETTSSAPVEETTSPATETPTTDPTSAEPSEPPVTDPTKAPPAGDTPPATYDEALARFDAVGQEPTELQRFESPTGNLYCVLDNDFIPPSCELLQGTIPAPDICGDGPSRVIGRIEFTDGDPQPVCNSDTIREPGAPTLAYGSVASAAGTSIQCLMETIGVTCINTATTQGFFLAKGTYAVFTAG